jgi:hypothetical protein
MFGHRERLGWLMMRGLSGGEDTAAAGAIRHRNKALFVLFPHYTDKASRCTHETLHEQVDATLLVMLIDMLTCSQKGQTGITAAPGST